MARVFTADEIIALARDIGKIPNTSATGSEDSDLLKLLNDYLQTTIAPAIMSVREGYFDRQYRTALSATTSTYRVNPRALLGCERDIRYVNSDGTRSPPLDQISPGDVDMVQDSQSASKPTGFYMEGNYIKLIPTMGSDASGYLEEVFPMRPSELVLVTNTRRVSSVSGTTITLTAAVPSGWDTDDTFDIHSKYSGAELKCWDKAAGTVSGTTIITSTDIDGTLTGEFAVEAGDYVCLSGECAVPAVPYEFHQVLARAIAAEFAESLGDSESAKLHSDRLTMRMKLLLDALKPRVSGKKKRHKKSPLISAQGRGRVTAQ